MIRRSFRIGLTLGILAGSAIALAKLLRGSPSAEATAGRTPTPAPVPAGAAPRPWPALTTDPAVPEPPSTALHPDPGAPVPHRAPEAAPAAAKPAARKAPAEKAKQPAATSAEQSAPWVEPAGGICPTTHPVKGKLASKIFHLPGMLNYDRTQPDRCYRDASVAEGDGLRQAKR